MNDEYIAFERLRSKMLAASLGPRSTIEETVQVYIRELPNLLSYELFSVYLLNRFGELRCIAHYYVGAGSILVPDKFGSDQWQSLLTMQSSRDYYGPTFWDVGKVPQSDRLRISFETSGLRLKDLCRVPLNGSCQTFGMFEVANRLPESSLPTKNNGQSELQRLMFVASTIASAVTLWRARNESFALADAVRVMAQFEIERAQEYPGPEVIFNAAVQAVVDRIKDYLVAVLRIESDDDTLKILAKGSDEAVAWDGWQSVDVSFGEHLAGIVYNSGEPRSVVDIADHPELFTNPLWLERSGLRSCACLPLMLGGKPIGTLTVYTGFRYDFSDLDRSLLLTLADSFALFWARLRVQQLQAKIEQQLHELQTVRDEKRIAEAREIAILPMVSLLHQSKNSFIEILNKLEGATDPKSRLVSEIAQTGMDRLIATEIMDSRSHHTFDVQFAISAIVKAKQNAWKKAGIRVQVSIEQLPAINIPSALFSEVMYNLLSNAERAIRRAKRERGTIVISACVEETARSQDLVIRIADNGVGIPKDKQELIFHRGYTTFSDTGGTGLGLFLSQDIVAGYRGSIYVESSRMGEGSVLAVRLPLSWLT